jgi:hypothetical protein
MTILVKHLPRVEDHDSQAKLTLSVALLESVLFVVSSEVALETIIERDLLIELIALHLVEVSFADI